MTYLLALIPISALGFFLAHYSSRSAKIPCSRYFYLATIMPIGFSVSSVLLFYFYWLFAPYGKHLTLITTLLLSGFLATSYFSTLNQTAPRPEPKEKPRAPQTWTPLRFGIILAGAIFFIFVFLRWLDHYASFTLSNIYGGWDASFCWNTKARFLFRSPEGLKILSQVDHSHPNYPLLVPGAITFGWFFAGQESQIWPPLVSAFFYISLALLIFWYLRSYAGIFAAFLGSAFFLSVGSILFWGACQYMDTPFAFFVTAAGLTLTAALRSGSFHLLLPCGWFAGCAAFTKNEGLFFCAWFLIFAGLMIWLHLKSKKREAFWRLIGGSLVPLAAASIIIFFLAIDQGEYAGSNRTFAGYLQALFGTPEKSAFLAKGFFAFMQHKTSWNHLWSLFFLAGLLGLAFNRLRGNFTWVSGFIAVTMLLGYFFILHLSPHRLGWQLETALHRLILHTSGLAIVFIFEIMGKAIHTKR